MYYVNRLKEKNYKVISIVAEKACDNDQNIFRRIKTERNFLNLLKFIEKTPMVNIILNGETLAILHLIYAEKGQIEVHYHCYC